MTESHGTPEQHEALNFGYECMKIHGIAHVFVWIGDHGWDGGYEVVGTRQGDGIAVTASPRIENMYLAIPGGSTN